MVKERTVECTGGAGARGAKWQKHIITTSDPKHLIECFICGAPVGDTTEERKQQAAKDRAYVKEHNLDRDRGMKFDEDGQRYIDDPVYGRIKI